MKQQSPKKKAMQIISLLLAAALFLNIQGFTVFAETISGNEGAENWETGSPKEDEMTEPDIEQPEDKSSPDQEGTLECNVSGNDLRAGGGNLANPEHHCTGRNDGTDDTKFSYIYFGSYPQSEVTDSSIIEAIENAIRTSETETNADAGMDVLVNGVKYRRISKTDTNNEGSFGDSEYRYFRWERIKWKVLKAETVYSYLNGELHIDEGTLFVMADEAIDCKKYDDSDSTITWENSYIRNWLNNSFYNMAFSRDEQNAIDEWNVVNEDNLEFGSEGGNDTEDKIYLLSLGEVIKEEYGFCKGLSVQSASRRISPSNYAHARGASIGSEAFTGGKDNCCWWLRSPGFPRSSIVNASESAAAVNMDGEVFTMGDFANRDYVGICPVLHINLASDVWSVAGSEEGESEKAANPTASIASGSSVAKSTKLSLSCATAGAQIYYTTDGTIPTTVSTLYTGEITLDRDMTIKAIAVCPGYLISDVVEFSYKLLESSNEKENGNDIKVQKISIKAPSKKLAAGKKVKLTLEVSPQNATNKAVQWKSSNKKYATVDKNGKITLKKNGIGKNVTITAVAGDGSGKKATIKIKIMRHAVKGIKLTAPKKTLKAGKSMTLKATVKTTGKSANKTLKWESSNKKYATVNQKGKVTAKKAGKGKTVTITATSTDGSNKKAKVKIKIK